MYSPAIVEKKLGIIRDQTGRKLKYHSLDQVETNVETFRRIIDKKGKMSRALKVHERDFILNEQLLCGIDFPYWAERYGTIYRDGISGGGVGRMQFWDSQDIAMSIIAKRQEQLAEATERGAVAEGILAVWHKARQLGATMLARLMLMHRLTLFKDLRSMGASVDEDKIQELYDRDKLIYDNLPFYLKPSLGYDEKRNHLYFDSNKSRILYQQAGQKSGLGTGRQFELSHLTEVALWPTADTMIEMDFFPTIPQAATSLSILESTALGRGNWWHEFSEEVRKGLRLNWVYIFIPWYAEPKKYRRTPPDSWRPNKMSQKHAAKVEETSPDLIGRRVFLERENLYWYETERDAYRRKGTLNVFLSNWCATPEESFQHSNQSAFPPEFLEQARLDAGYGVPYELGFKNEVAA